MENTKDNLWISKAPFKVATLAPPIPPSFSFMGTDNNELLKFENNGDIFVNGKLVENNKEVVEGMMAFLTVHGVTALRTAYRDLLKEVEELREYKAMYEDLCK